MRTQSLWLAVSLALSPLAARADSPAASLNAPVGATPNAPATPPAATATAATAPAAPAPAAAEKSPPPQPTFDRIVFAKMYAGFIPSETVDNDGHGGTAHGWAICHCKIDALWAVLTNHAHYPEFVPRVTKMEISQRTDHSERAQQEIDASISTVKYSLDYNWDVATRTVSFHMVEDLPHDLKAVQGAWHMWPIEHGDYTLYDYESAVDTGRSIPGFIRDYLADRGLKDTMNAMRLRAEGKPAEK